MPAWFAARVTHVYAFISFISRFWNFRDALLIVAFAAHPTDTLNSNPCRVASACDPVAASCGCADPHQQPGGGGMPIPRLGP